MVIGASPRFRIRFGADQVDFRVKWIFEELPELVAIQQAIGEYEAFAS